MSTHEPLKTILSDEFRVELQPVENGPTLTVSGHGHDPNLTLTVRGLKSQDEDNPQYSPQDVAAIQVTLAQLFDLAERVKKAMQR